MLKFLAVVTLCLTATACRQLSDEEALRQVYALGPDSPPTAIIIRRYAAISVNNVTMQFDFPSDCKNLREVGILTGAGRADQSNQEIMGDLMVRAAKVGANWVTYEVAVSSIEEVREVLTSNSRYMLYRCD